MVSAAQRLEVKSSPDLGRGLSSLINSNPDKTKETPISVKDEVLEEAAPQTP